MRSGGKDGGTKNSSNHLKQNHPGNKEVKLILEEGEDSNEKAPNSEEASIIR